MFVLGLILGAVLGVIADRLWGKVERRARLRFDGYWFEDGSGRGIGFRIKNVGKADIPPFSACLFHPLRGSWFVFPRYPKGSLLPQQETKCQCVLIRTSADKERRPHVNLAQMFRKENGTTVTEAETGAFVFRLVMDSSEHVVYQNAAIGKAAAALIAKSLQRNTMRGLAREFASLHDATEAANTSRAAKLLVSIRKAHEALPENRAKRPPSPSQTDSGARVERVEAGDPEV